MNDTRTARQSARFEPAWIDPERTALVIVDMQADFAAPDGAAARAGANLAAVPAALEGATRLVDAAREAGVPVVFVGLQTDPETQSAAWARRISRRGGDPQAELALCRAGSLGAAFVGPRPVSGDLVIAKGRYSGFFATDLNAALSARRRDTLVVCGLTTECCVDCTVRDAFHLDYHVFIAADACASYDPAAHEAALASLAANFALIVAVDAVARAWEKAVA